METYGGSMIPGAIYGLSSKARCICVVSGETEINRFWAGTQNVSEENEVHLIEIPDGALDNEAGCVSVGIYPHLSGEIWDMIASPSNSRLLLTSSFGGGRKSIVSLLKLGDEEKKLESVSSCDFFEDKDFSGGSVKFSANPCRLVWNPSSDNQVGVSFGNSVCLVDTESDCKLVDRMVIDGLRQIYGMAWNPHHSSQLAVFHESRMKLWDIRACKEVSSLNDAHEQYVRDVDFNPNCPYNLCTGGDDCKLKFWDVRKFSSPLKTFSNHTHWIWSTKYNPFHDQLVLSSGSDCRVNLWHVESLSSYHLAKERDSDDVQGKLPEDISSSNTNDRLAQVYSDHEDSVYQVAWSVCNPWNFASLSYDGRVVINYVPTEYCDILKY